MFCNNRQSSKNEVINESQLSTKVTEPIEVQLLTNINHQFIKKLKVELHYEAVNIHQRKLYFMNQHIQLSTFNFQLLTNIIINSSKK